MGATLLRAYAADELGGDGYPLAWHRCPGCNGTGWRCAHTGGPAARGRETCCSAPGACMSSDGCRDCSAPGGCGGIGSIKALVRALADHRCVRCGHPYRPGEHGCGEWSPCDERCEHAGPCRLAVDRLPDGRVWREVGFGPIDCAPGFVEAGRVEARWRILTVHHLDGDKANCRWWNLASLCQRCHLTIQGKVVMDRRWPHEHSDWFKPYVAGYYAWSYLGEDVSREQAVERMDELLALEHRQLDIAALVDGGQG